MINPLKTTHVNYYENFVIVNFKVSLFRWKYAAKIYRKYGK